MECVAVAGQWHLKSDIVLTDSLRLLNAWRYAERLRNNIVAGHDEVPPQPPRACIPIRCLTLPRRFAAAMNIELEDVLADMPEMELSKFSGLADMEIRDEQHRVQLARAMWVDEFGAMSPADLEGFRDEVVKAPGFSRQLWSAFMTECQELLCTNSAKYASLRSDVARLKGKPAGTILATVSAAVANHVGLEAGLLIPFVAIVAGTVSSVGLNVACRIISAQIEE